MSTPGCTCAIVGGGVLGLELARRLSLAGRRVAVYEAAPDFGGLASAWSLGPVRFDRHYHVALRSDLHTQAWLTELGLGGEFVGAQTRTGFYTGGKHHSMSNSYEFARFKPLGPMGKVRLAATIAYASRLKSWRKLEGIPVADWLTRLSGRRVFEKIWLPLLRSKLGEGYRDTSAAFIWATIKRMNSARDAGLKREEFGHVRGGYGRVFDRLVAVLADLGAELRPGTPVTRVEVAEGGGVRVVTASGDASGYDSAVLTVPTPAISKLVPGLTGDEHARLNAVRYQGIVCASVLLKKPLAGFYVTNITDAGLPFTAVIEMTALVPPSEFGGHTLVYLPKYADPADPIFAEDDDSVRARFLAGLARMHPHISEGDVLAFRVSRVKHVFAVPTLNYSAIAPPVETSIPGLSVATSAQIVNGTLNVNETLALVGRVLPRLLAAPAHAMAVSP